MMCAADLPTHVLLVEDNPGDVLLVAEALQESGMAHVLHVAVDGQEAMNFLHRRGDFAGSPRPHLVLLDLNLPNKDGREVLVEMKKDPVLCVIPVIVLTSSSADQEVAWAYRQHANSYIVKPAAFTELAQMLDITGRYWMSVVRLPSSG